MHGVDDAAGEPEGAALALAEFTASPAGVDEPAVDFVLRHTFSKHLGVAAGLDEEVNKSKRGECGKITYVQDNERCTITSRESRNGFKDSIFSSGGFPERQCLNLYNQN